MYTIPKSFRSDLDGQVAYLKWANTAVLPTDGFPDYIKWYTLKEQLLLETHAENKSRTQER